MAEPLPEPELKELEEQLKHCGTLKREDIERLLKEVRRLREEYEPPIWTQDKIDKMNARASDLAKRLGIKEEATDEQS